MAQLSFQAEAVAMEAFEHWQHRDLTVAFRKVGLADLDPGTEPKRKGGLGPNKITRLTAVFDGVRKRRDQDDARRLQSLILHLVNTSATNPTREPQWLDPLREELRACGFELRQTVSGESWSQTASYKLLPSDATPVPIEPDLNALETELEASGYPVALGHYSQALRNYLAGDLEASNGQLRSFLEDLLVELGRRHGDYQGAEPVAAVQRLQERGLLAKGQNNLLRGLWDVSQERGAHRGQSNAGEARFRLQTTTSIALFLLRQLEGDV